MGIRRNRGTVALAATVIAATGIASIAIASSGSKHGRAANAGPARNVIFFVGDGMGQAHRNLIREANVGLTTPLNMDKLTLAGLVRTDPEDPTTTVTDSAASATAYASGIKTLNGAVGVDNDGTAVPTILEQARKLGKSTGLVTTSQVTDATPAAFGAHVPDRDEQSEIARQYIEESKPDVILGGGEDRWLPEGTAGAFPDNPPDDPEEQSSSDKGNLIEAAQAAGYEYVSSPSALANAKGRKLLGLFANEEMFQQRAEGEGDEYDPVVPLPDMTRKAIATLDRSKKGFFLMVEEEAIDEMSHNNNAKRVIESGKALDDSVAIAREYARSHPDTLVIVGADHECGGLTVEDGAEDSSDGPFTVPGTNGLTINADWTTTGHTGADVPFTSEGPGSERLAGVIDNTEVYDAMASALGVRQPRRSD